jgi:fluoride exporter
VTERSASSDWFPAVAPAVIAVIAVGGVIGALARWAIEEAIPTDPGHFPWATLLINISGSALLGALLVVVCRLLPRSQLIGPFLGTGVLGAYTTFSTFGVETAELVRTHHSAVAAAYVVTSVVAGVAAAVLGIIVACAALPRADATPAGVPVATERSGATP